MTNYLATVYAFGFHAPKPLHPLIVRNWARAQSIRFIIVTDHGSDWRLIVPADALNIDILQIDVEHLFELAFPLLGVTTFRELKRDRGWLFTQGDFQMGGYLGCQLRPALSTLLPCRRTPYWGWIDNDVFVNAPVLDEHLRANSAAMVLYPRADFAWEQFKLYSSDLNTTVIYKEMLDWFIDNKTPPPGPMEARFIYHIRDIGKYTLDGIGQEQAAIHWSYLDAVARERGPLPNQYPVTISADASTLIGPDGQRILFFNADTQTKKFSVPDAAQMQAAMGSGLGYEFAYSADA